MIIEGLLTAFRCGGKEKRDDTPSRRTVIKRVVMPDSPRNEV